MSDTYDIDLSKTGALAGWNGLRECWEVRAGVVTTDGAPVPPGDYEDVQVVAFANTPYLRLSPKVASTTPDGYALTDGRTITRDGKPFVYIGLCHDNDPTKPFNFPPADADQLARWIVDALNYKDARTVALVEALTMARDLLDQSDVRHFIATQGEQAALHRCLNTVRRVLAIERSAAV